MMQAVMLLVELNKVGLSLFFLILGIALDQIVFPRNKTTNVSGDLIESQKKKDNSKVKTRRGIFGWLKRDENKKIARKLMRINKSLPKQK